MTKRISFSVDQEQAKAIETKARTEGLTPSQFAKRSTVLAAQTMNSWETSNTSYVSDSSSRTINNQETAADTFRDIADRPQENMMVALLNQRNQVIKRVLVHVGTLNSCPAHSREIFREAVKNNAASVIIAHNHPSGNITPSPQDIDLTKRVVKAGKILGIPVLDHVIVASGTRRFSSIRDQRPDLFS
jgi:DNA repair protein RadC